MTLVSSATVDASGPADLRRQRRLAALVDDLGRGIDAAREIWANWYEAQRFGQDHPGMSPGDYIASLGLRLTLPEAMAALPNGSTREIAAVAGVSKNTVQRARPVPNGTPAVRGADGKQYPARVVRAVKAEIIEPAVAVTTEEPSEVVDTHLWDTLVGVMDAIEALSFSDAPSVAATIPVRRRAATAKKLRRLGTYLGRIAWTLEGKEEQT